MKFFRVCLRVEKKRKQSRRVKAFSNQILIVIFGLSEQKKIFKKNNL
jgi:hypothetical protein